MKTKQDYYRLGVQHGGKLDAPAFDLNKDHTSWQARAYVSGYQDAAGDHAKPMVRASDDFSWMEARVSALEGQAPSGATTGRITHSARQLGKSNLVEAGQLLALVSSKAKEHRWGPGPVSHAVCLVRQIVALDKGSKKRDRYELSLGRLMDRHSS